MKRFAVVLLAFAAACSSTRVPDVTEQRGLPAPQAVSALDISDDGRFIAVTTLAFRQDPNFWLLSREGEIVSKRTIAPWAPQQVATLDGGRAFGVGLAYSRVTSPLPTISLFTADMDEETVLEDSQGERGWLRYGEGDWRSGWMKSLLGDLLVRAGNSVITVRGHNGSIRMLGDGERQKYALKGERPFRMTACPDGRRLVCGYIVPDPVKPSASALPLFNVLESSAGTVLWNYVPSLFWPKLSELPRPSRDLPALAERFKLDPDALVPFRVAASVAPNSDASIVAVAEYGGWLWTRQGPAIGKWDPPYHVVPFVPRQRGWLRVVTAPGTESIHVEFPRNGLFELRTDAKGTKIWAVPMSWFARGMAGSAWLPTDEESRAVFEFDVAQRTWRTAWEFSDAVADVALHPEADRAWISCWDGRLRLLGRDRRVLADIDAGAPARVTWSQDGRFAVAGTELGEVLGLDGGPQPKWRTKLPSTDAPALEAPLKPVFEGIPVYSVGRVGKEHAYVGDIWLIKSAAGGFLIDAGGSSSLPFTLKKISAAGVDLKDIRYLLHTHSHGDHCGAAYLWRSMGLRIVAPESAAFAMSWLMPMLTDYGVWVPRPVDVPLALKQPGDEVEFSAAGVPIRAIFVPGHSMDSVLYLMELGGKRVVFTGDIGFQAPSDILHRCWGDVEKAKVVTAIVREKVLPYRPDVVFTGHGGRAEGTAFLEDLTRRSEESIEKARAK